MTRRLDVAIVLSTLGLVRGGLETTMTRLAEGLAARGHRITLVGGARPVGRLPDDLAALPVRSVRVPCIPLDLRAWQPVRARRPGLPLQAQSLSFVSACLVDRRVRRLLAGADVTLTALEIETVLVSRWRGRAGRPNVSLFPGVIDVRWLRHDRSRVRLATSLRVAEQGRDVLGLRVDDVLVTGPPASWLAEPYTVRPQPRTLLFVGRLEPNKGVRELLEIFEALAPRFPELQLRLVGEGPERLALTRRLAMDGLAERVRLVGAVPPDQVLSELRAADLLVFPSHHEAFSKALLEAMAVGLPVVASDIPGNREVADDAACLIELGRATAWGAATARLIADPVERRRMSTAGRERAARFTAERAVQVMERWLSRALEA